MPGARGDVELQAGEHGAVRLIYTNRAIRDAELALGRGIIKVLMAARDSDLSVGDVAKLLQIGMEYARRDGQRGGRQVTEGEAFEVMDQAGFGPTAAAVFEGLSAVLSYDGQDGEGNPTAPTGS